MGYSTTLRRAGVFGVSAWLVLAAAMTIGALASAARGQMMFSDSMGGGRSGQPVTAEEVERYARILGLDADQDEALRMVFEAVEMEYTEAEQAAETRRRALIDSVREAQAQGKPFDHTVFRDKMPAIEQAQRDAWGRLEKQFFDDMRAIVTPDQAERWPAIERQRRRDRDLGEGRLAGESVDLIALSEKVGIPEESRSEVDPLLRRYELDLDRALLARDESVSAARAMLGGPGEVRLGAPPAPGTVAQIMGSEEFAKARAEAQDARRSLREVNDRYARQVSAALPPDASARFTEAYRAASYPRIFRDPYFVRALDGAGRFEDLTEAQRAEIDSIRAAWQRESGTINDRWASAVHQAENEQGIDASMPPSQLARMAEARGETSPIAEAWQARRDLESRMLDRLKGVLTDGQRDRLPQPRQRGRSVTLPGGGEFVIDGEEEDGPGGMMFFTSTDGEGGLEESVVVVRRNGGPPPPPGEGPVFLELIREVGPNGEEVEVHIEHGDGAPPPDAPNAPKDE